MDRQIKFNELEISDRSISVTATYDDLSYPLTFDFDRHVDVTEREVAIALSTLCGTKFSSIEMDLALARQDVETLSQFTKSTLTVASTTSEPVEHVIDRAGNVLSFSGGFDSLAALALMPADTHLVSMNFGGWFKREAKFFKNFEPLVLTTNVRKTPTHSTSLVRNHWTYMAIGAILTSRHFGAKYHTFGNIFASSIATNDIASSRIIPLEMAGLQDAPYVNGLTEVGTAKIILQAYPDLVGASLASLAAFGDKKGFSKAVIANIVNTKLGSPATLPAPPSNDDWPPERKIPFGNTYATSMSLIYAISNGQAEIAAPLFTEIPKAAVNFAKSIDTSFMEQFNYDECQFLAPELWPDFWAKLTQYGFRPYFENEWKDVGRMREFLNLVIAD